MDVVLAVSKKKNKHHTNQPKKPRRP